MFALQITIYYVIWNKSMISKNKIIKTFYCKANKNNKTLFYYTDRKEK